MNRASCLRAQSLKRHWAADPAPPCEYHCGALDTIKTPPHVPLNFFRYFQCQSVKLDCCLPKDNTENIITICKDSWSETSATQGSYETFLLRVLVQCFQIMAIIVRKYFLLNRLAVSSFVLQRSTQLLVQSRDGRQAESLF